MMQETDFPFELIIHDDASTDGTVDIVREFEEKYNNITAIYQNENQFSKGIGLILADFTLSRARGEYVIINEGDDFFTDPHKLQKQADYLDQHLDCALCFHPVRVVYEDGSRPEHLFPSKEMLGGKNILTLEDLLKYNFIQTNSCMYRWGYKGKKITSVFPKNILPGDYFLHILHAKLGLIGYIDEVMSSYRRHQESLWDIRYRDEEAFYKLLGVQTFNWFLEVEKIIGSYAASFRKNTIDTEFDHRVRRYITSGMVEEILQLIHLDRNAPDNVRKALESVSGVVAEKKSALEQTQGLLKQTQEALAQTQEALAQTQEAFAQTQGALTQTQGNLAQTQGNLAQAQGTLAQTQRELVGVYGSRAWRVTYPLRVIADRLRQGRSLAREAVHYRKVHGFPALVRKLFSKIFGRGVAVRMSVALPPAPDIVPSALEYERWVKECDTLSGEDRLAIGRHIQTFTFMPLISVVMPAYETPAWALRATIESVRSQLYPNWQLCIADDASPSPHVTEILRTAADEDNRIRWMRRETNGNISAASNSALSLASGEFIALLDHDDILPPHALYEVVAALNKNPDLDIIYSDEDQIDEHGRRQNAYFKTDWNIELLLGHNMVSHLGVYRRELVERVGGFRVGFEGSQDYDLTLRCADTTSAERIHHIPAILYHWRREFGAPSFSERKLEVCADAARRAVADHLQRCNEAGTAHPHPGLPAWTRVIRPIPLPAPLVSLIVPTRDKADLLEQCAKGLLQGTNYPNIELLIVDHESRSAETHRLFEHLKTDPRVSVLPYAGPFNYSAINNMAVARSRGSIVGLINNDIEVIDVNWLSEMVSLAMLPGVGAVGAKLLYPNNTVQHGGVVLGSGGVANHFSHLLPRHAPGYFGRSLLASSVSGVTGACLVVKKAIYEEVGGLDEENLAVAFNDVDLCLKIRQKGYRNVWTPYAELFHHESASRGPDATPEKAARFKSEVDFMLRKWGPQLPHDPFYNDNFSLEIGHCFDMAFPSRRVKPWKEDFTYDRMEMLRKGLLKSQKIIEIGPLNNPIAPKREGWLAYSIDHASQEELRAKYKVDNSVDPNLIEPVDFVWTTGSLSDAVPLEHQGTFDVLIASHVIEHFPDLVAFLQAAETLTKADGCVVLAIPDKRVCFDYYRPVSTIGDVMEAHHQQRVRHSRKTLWDYFSYVAAKDKASGWARDNQGALRLCHTFKDAEELNRRADSNEYIDAHAWVFVPSSFALIVLELARLGLTDWRIERSSAAEITEFFVWLRRGGRAAASRMTEEEFSQARTRLLEATMFDLDDQSRQMPLSIGGQLRRLKV